MVKPSFVFVPGAWHRAEIWNKVAFILEAQGYKCLLVTLPTTNGSNTSSFVDDVHATQDMIRSETSQGRDVVVVVHSYGGVVGQSAMKGFTVTKDSGNNTGHVIGQFIIASGFAIAGMTFLDGTGGVPPPTWGIDPSGFAELRVPARELFYHDLPEEEGHEWVARLTKQSMKAFTEGRDVTYTGWLEVPNWLLMTTDDKALPIDTQRMMAAMVKDQAKLTVREIATSHSPMLSKPEEVANMIIEATNTFTTVKDSASIEFGDIPANIK
ncbi:uncharacterized protein PV09_08508 [Verruconis gallopava]|uniref:AB hydrolase-1 domain-containing protein n=1 Tax=Verruconis gallopava TaxID=253628 RepID=A0A0D2A0J7_9PEZI|nr:uncharacterized protein PV09_08508 [Verruconis gallopava]KIV99839.1 hypothetical protein PV09_08508 [Verruconis gallopava]